MKSIVRPPSHHNTIIFKSAVRPPTNCTVILLLQYEKCSQAPYTPEYYTVLYFTFKKCCQAIILHILKVSKHSDEIFFSKKQTYDFKCAFFLFRGNLRSKDSISLSLSREVRKTCQD